MMHGRVVDANGNETWHDHGTLHRIDGPAVIIKNGPEEYWYQNGILHRKDGPAVVKPHIRYWFLNDVLHRLGGPAVEYTDAAKINLYYINGERYDSIEDYNLVVFSLFKTKVN